MEIRRIASFSADHDIITPGMYISRIDGDVVTYDLRTRTPNAGDYMDDLTIHSVEHMLATFMRNGDIADETFREALIDTFLVAAYVYDDHCKIVFNLGGKHESSTLPFNIEDVAFSDTCIESLKLHQTFLYELYGLPVVMIGDLFVFEKRFKDTL